MSQPSQQPPGGRYPPICAGTPQGYPPSTPPGYQLQAAMAPSPGSAAYPPPPAEPTFQVQTVKHTGAAIIWLNQRHGIAGSYSHCDAAIDDAQQHCMLAGSWSFGSLVWNPISLARNAVARKELRLQARRAHDYARWWTTYYGGGPNAPVWAPPPARPAYTKWWMWLPLILIPLVVALITALVIASSDGHRGHQHPEAPIDEPLPTLSFRTFPPPTSP